MRYRKKLLKLIIFVIILFGYCGYSSSISELFSIKEKKKINGSISEEQSKEDGDLPVQLTWFSDVDFWNPPTTWSTDEDTVQGAITKATGCTFEMDIPPANGDEQLSLMLINNNLADVISITNPDMVSQLINSGKVWQLDEFLKKYDPQSHLLTDFPQDMMKDIIHKEGGWYSYPSHMSSADLRKQYPASCQENRECTTLKHNNQMFFNEALMKEAGITLDDLQTEAGVMKALQKVKDLNLQVEGNTVIPLLVDKANYKNPVLNDFTLEYLADTFGAMPVDSEGNYRDIVLAPEMKHAFKFLNTAIRKEYMKPDQLTQNISIVRRNLMKGSVFCFIGNTANTGIDRLYTSSYISPGAMLSSDGKTPVMDVYLQPGTGWMQTFVTKDCKYPEQTAKWLSYMSSRVGMLVAMYGFEGVDYYFDENGHLIQTEKGLEDAKNATETGVYAYWPFHNVSFIYSVLPKSTDEAATKAINIQCALGKDPETKTYDGSLIVFPADLIDPNSELWTVQEKLLEYREEQIFRILLSKDDDSFNQLYDEFISTLKEYGIEKINAVFNKAYQTNCERYDEVIVTVNGD